MQTHVPDKLNFAPRAGFTWAPFKSGKTTLRGSWGMFYDWLPTGTYAQTLQVDGFRQREFNIINPSYPDPGDSGADAADESVPPGGGSRMAYSQRLSAGIAQTISRRINTNVLYSYGYRYSLLDRPQPQRAGQRRQARSGRSRTSSSRRPDGKGRSTTSTRRSNINLGPMPAAGPAPPGGGGGAGA